MKGLIAINCCHNYKVEEDGKCYSKECMMNVDPVIAHDIQKKGCILFTKDFVKEEIEKKKK